MRSEKVSLAVRESIAFGLVAIILLLLFIGLINLQVVHYSELSEKSENNRIRVVPIVPRRGLLLDREGRVIVGNRPSYSVAIIPAEEIKGQTVANLAQLLDADTTHVRNRIKRNMVGYHQPATIRRDLPFEAVAVLEEQSGKFPGVGYQMDRLREYLTGASIEAFTGFVDEVSAEELKRVDSARYRLGSMIGKKGIEKTYDTILRGREGTQFIEVKASGQLLGQYAGRETISDIPGADLVLGIDLDLQQKCVEVLKGFCCGAMVAMDPRTGEVLAMASYPGYEANIFASVVPDSLWKALQADSSHPLLNRPVNGLYPPGSTVKFVTIGAGLDEHFINQNTMLPGCLGGMQFGNRYFRCWEEAGHGQLTPAEAIEHSCDVYMYQLGMKMGPELLANYYLRCGFGRPTGIDLPGEYGGTVPTTAYYNKRYGENKWTRTLVLNTSIGQGELLTTPLQLAQFFCGLAMDGVVYRPHVVKEIHHPDGQVEKITPEVSFELPFTKSTMDLLQRAMRLVVEGPGGTARRLRNSVYSIGGKTGTAQNPHGNEHSWFVGVAPLDSPEIVCAAIVENAGHGSDVAAPAVGEVIKTYMYKKLGISDTVKAVAADTLLQQDTLHVGL